MKRRKVDVLKYHDIGDMRFQPFVDFVAELRAKIPDDCMEDVEFEIESEYDSRTVYMHLSYTRPPTEHEQAIDAIEAERKLTQAAAKRILQDEKREIRELRMYLALKKKYGELAE